jgi:hypothetical protein
MAISWDHCYTCYTDPLKSTESTTATFTDVTAILAKDSDPGISSQKLQTDMDAAQKWLKKMWITANESKSVHVTFTT